jgi:hypothetical protein
VSNDNEQTPYVLIRDDIRYGTMVYTLAKMYGDSPMSYTPNQRDKTTLVEELRAIADMIEDDQLLVYERTLGFHVVELPALPAPEPAQIEGPIERAIRESRESKKLVVPPDAALTRRSFELIDEINEHIDNGKLD